MFIVGMNEVYGYWQSLAKAFWAEVDAPPSFDPEPRSNPNVPTLDTLNDALFAQFAEIRSVAVETGDYGSGGRGFESLPARFADSAF